MIRPLEAQFEATGVTAIHKLAGRVKEIRYAPGASRYYGLELVSCLEAGALLASLVVASSLLDLHMRALVVHYTTQAHSRLKPETSINLEAKLESMKQVGFGDLVVALAGAGLLDEVDAKKAMEHYKNIRIPLLHGLPARFINQQTGSRWGDLLRGSSPVSVRELEDIIEGNALSMLDSIVGIMERSAF